MACRSVDCAIQSFTYSDLQIQLAPAGDAAFASYRAAVRTKNSGKDPIEESYFETDVFCKRAGHWKLVEIHDSLRATRTKNSNRSIGQSRNSLRTGQIDNFSYFAARSQKGVYYRCAFVWVLVLLRFSLASCLIYRATAHLVSSGLHFLIDSSPRGVSRG